MLRATSGSGLLGSVDQTSLPCREGFSMDALTKFLEGQGCYNDRTLDEVSDVCLGTRDLSCGVEERLMHEVLVKLPYDIVSRIQIWYERNKQCLPLDISKDLLKYSERLKRSRDMESAGGIRELAIKWALLPVIRDLDKDVPMGFRKALTRLEEIQEKMKELSDIPAQNANLSFIQAFIQKIVPKKTSKKDIVRYAEFLRSHIQRFLEDNMFENVANLLHPNDRRKSFIWMCKEQGGLLLTFCPDANTFRKRAGGVREFLVTEIFIPIEGALRTCAFKAQTSTLLIYEKAGELITSLDLTNRRLVWQLPDADKYFTSDPTFFIGPKTYVKKAAGYKSFQIELESTFTFLSPLDTLRVCQNVALGVQALTSIGKVSLDISPKNG